MLWGLWFLICRRGSKDRSVFKRRNINIKIKITNLDAAPSCRYEFPQQDTKSLSHQSPSLPPTMLYIHLIPTSKEKDVSDWSSYRLFTVSGWQLFPCFVLQNSILVCSLSTCRKGDSSYTELFFTHSDKLQNTHANSLLLEADTVSLFSVEISFRAFVVLQYFTLNTSEVSVHCHQEPCS